MPLKICPNCHRGCNDDNEYCPTCNTKLPDAQKTLPTVDNSKPGPSADKQPSINPMIAGIAIVGLIIIVYFSMGMFFPKTGESASSLQGSESLSTPQITSTPTYNYASPAPSEQTPPVTPSITNNQQESSITPVPSATISSATTPISQTTSAVVTTMTPSTTASSTIGTIQPKVSVQTPNPATTLTSQQLLNSGGKGKIAFYNGKGISVMNSDGTGETNLINNVNVDSLAWSPDGSKIVIANGEIETLNADGSGLTTINNDYGDYSAVWSSQNNKIFFYSIGKTVSDRGIFMINPDGSDKTLINNITPLLGTDKFSISPDNTKLAYSGMATYKSDLTGHTWSCGEVFVANLDGSDSNRLTLSPMTCTPNSMVGDGNPVWSPDGKKIAFVSSGQFADVSGLGNPYDRISVINADGTGQSYLTYETHTSSAEPVWSPDSTKIAYTSNNDGHFNIYVINADGTDQTRLTNDTNNDMYPTWG